jgi:hypothetical protein
MCAGRGRTSRLTWVGVCAVLLAASIDCSLPFGGGPTPAQMLSRALTTLRDFPSLRLSGSLRRLDVSYTITLSEDNRGNLSGTVADGHFSIGFRRVDGKVLLSGQDFFQQLHQLRVAGLWVTGVNDGVSALVTALADRPALVGALSTLVGGAVSVAAGPRVGGRQATWLVSDGISVLIDEQDPERPLSLTTMPGRTLPGGFTNLVLEFNSYGKPVNRDVPTEVVDLADPNTLPTNVVSLPDSFRYEACDSGGCTLSSVVRNDGGRNGRANATFTVSRDGQQIGSCLVGVPPLGNKETVKVACRVDYPRTTGSSVTGRVMVSNSLP